MRIFLVHNPLHISPLDEPARDAWLFDCTLGKFTERELKLAGLIIEHAGSLAEAEESARKEASGAFILLDSVVCSRLVVQRFVREARKRPGIVCMICALPKAMATDLMSHMDGLEEMSYSGSNKKVWTVPFYFLKGNSSIANAAPLELPYKEQLLKFKMPVGFVGRREDVHPTSESYMCNANNWVHVLRLNLSAMAACWNERWRRGFWLWGVSWYLWRILMGFPWKRGRIIEGLCSVSNKAKIHHSACLQLALVGKKATINPNCFIQNSYIGEGADIATGAQVINSVIADGAYVGRNAVIFSSVVYPGAFAGQFLMQGSVLGRDSVAFTNSGFFDLNFTKNARIAHRGGYADAGSPFLGVCLGPEARIAAGVWVGSGREIPKGTLIVKHPSGIVNKIGDIKPGEPSVVQDGLVVSLKK